MGSIADRQGSHAESERSSHEREAQTTGRPTGGPWLRARLPGTGIPRFRRTPVTGFPPLSLARLCPKESRSYETFPDFRPPIPGCRHAAIRTGRKIVPALCNPTPPGPGRCIFGENSLRCASHSLAYAATNSKQPTYLSIVFHLDPAKQASLPNPVPPGRPDLRSGPSLSRIVESSVCAAL